MYAKWMTGLKTVGRELIYYGSRETPTGFRMFVASLNKQAPKDLVP
jgi:hypothetical protein